jgi:hypothetical protein
VSINFLDQFPNSDSGGKEAMSPKLVSFLRLEEIEQKSL